MTNNNLFQEIEEDLERQRLENLWKRYGGLVIAAAFAVVLGTAGYTAWNSWQAEKHQKATGGLIEILNAADTAPAQEIEALKSFADTNSQAVQAIFARLEAASLAGRQGDKAKSLELYNAVAADAKADPAFRQFGDLMAVRMQLDSADPAALEKRLQPLAADDAPWRLSAREYQGYLALRTGDKIKARQIFNELAQNGSAPHSLSDRANDMLQLLAE